MRKVLKIVLSVVAVVLVAALGYVAYVVLSYDRIKDHVTIAPEGTAQVSAAKVGETYRILTQNIGFGAYTADYTFFMDGGKESRARSPESVRNCVEQAAFTASEQAPDFILFQEVDTDSTRSFHINEYEILKTAFSDRQTVFAENYHSAYLFYPFLKPHGASNSGLVTVSRIGVTSALRRSLPISTGFSKFLDLDRCYSVSRIPTDNGRELLIYNVHSSAYGGSDEIRAAQMNMLFGDMKAEYEKGNYCVCGGDFNHDFTGDSTQKLNGFGDIAYGWAQPFPSELLPEGIVRCDRYTGDKILPTCRNCDIPYEEGNFTIIVDGFLVSENVTVSYLENIQTGFAYADHSPVVMEFTLNEA